MATNSGKRLERLEKVLETIAARGKRHHFIIANDANHADQLIAQGHKAGTIAEGDDVQTIICHWKPQALRGDTFIPQGDDTDPYADPRSKATGDTSGRGIDSDCASSQALDPPPSQEARWKRHVAEIERKGQRFQG